MTLRVNKYSKFIASKLFYYNLPCATEIWETALLTFIKIYSLEVTVPVWWRYHVLGCHWASLPNSLFWDVMLAAWNWSLWEYLHDGNWQELQILKEINFWIFIKRDDVETEALILWPPDVEKTLLLARIEGRRRKGWQRMRWLDGIIGAMGMSWANSRRWWRTGSLVCCSPWGHKGLHTA